MLDNFQRKNTHQSLRTAAVTAPAIPISGLWSIQIYAELNAQMQGEFHRRFNIRQWGRLTQQTSRCFIRFDEIFNQRTERSTTPMCSTILLFHAMRLIHILFYQEQSRHLLNNGVLCRSQGEPLFQTIEKDSKVWGISCLYMKWLEQRTNEITVGFQWGYQEFV